jgi:hypothetical protein
VPFLVSKDGTANAVEALAAITAAIIAANDRTIMMRLMRYLLYLRAGLVSPAR